MARKVTQQCQLQMVYSSTDNFSPRKKKEKQFLSPQKKRDNFSVGITYNTLI